MKLVPIHFWGIGAQKAGTTWLYHNLKLVPSFSLPPLKELHYFDKDLTYPSPSFLKDEKFLKRLFTRSWLKRLVKDLKRFGDRKDFENIPFYFKWHFKDYTDEWYLSLFDSFHGLRGEITPSYSILKVEDIQRMYALSPQARIIFMLRNPVDRAWSHFKHVHRNKDSLDNFISLDRMVQFVNSQAQMSRSNYLGTILRYSKVFPKEQILLGFYDAISDNAKVLFKNIVEFISSESSMDLTKCKLRQKVYKSKHAVECPDEIYFYLKSLFHEQIKVLASRFGGYCSKWLFDLYGEEVNLAEGRINPTLSLGEVESIY